jgi:DnaJ-domain-containing protein 1
MLVLAFVLVVREDWLPAAVFAFVSAGMAVGARKRRAARKDTPPTRSAAEMTERDAREMLGVDDQAGPEEIESAYRRLIRRVHPDLGGAAGLAAQLNAARSRLRRGP